jgi:hypothetical protein
MPPARTIPIVGNIDVPPAHLLLREPYRVLFPWGALLAWAGVSHWTLHALGVISDYHSIFHAMTQIQGFLMSFAVGFLFTMIPRRTGTAAPSWVELAIGIGAPIGTTVSAWFEAWAVSQVFWLVLAGTLLRFAVSRFTSSSAKRKPPNGFVWIPAAFLFGIAGAVLTAAGAIAGGDYWWLHTFGRGLVLQAMFLALVAGVGSLAIPMMTRGEAPKDGTNSRRDRVERLAHVAGALALLASFFIEQWSAPVPAFALRGAVMLAVLLASAKLWKRPSLPGWNRRAIWVASWMLPLGYFVAAAFPGQWKAGLHITFIGGLALLTFSVSTHVVLGHGNFMKELAGRSMPLILLSASLFLAMIFRALMDFDPDHFFLWMGVASSLFLLATIAWISVVARGLLPKARP